jgi:hypothetical protein
LHSNPQIIKKKKHLSYNPILKGNSGPKLKAEISFISEYPIKKLYKKQYVNNDL